MDFLECTYICVSCVLLEKKKYLTISHSEKWQACNIYMCVPICCLCKIHVYSKLAYVYSKFEGFLKRL